MIFDILFSLMCVFCTGWFIREMQHATTDPALDAAARYAVMWFGYLLCYWLGRGMS